MIGGFEESTRRGFFEGGAGAPMDWERGRLADRSESRDGVTCLGKSSGCMAAERKEPETSQKKIQKGGENRNEEKERRRK